jgi:Asparagine synthase
MYAHDSTDIVLPSESLRSEPSNQTPLLALVWLRGNRREQDARMVVEDVLRHACGPYGLTALTGGDAQLAWGVLLPDKFAPLTCWSIYVSGAELCLVEGDIYDDLPGLQILPGDNPGLGRRIAAHMREQPDRRLTDLIGIYSGIYVDRDRSSAYAFGDPTGTRPVFWLSDATRFVVMSDLWAYRGWSGFERHWDKMALVELLTIGLPMAGRTWLEGVKQLQRGRQIRTFADGRTEVRMLLEPIPRQSWSFRESVRALRESMDETIGRLCRRLDSPVGLALSGGLDSRLLLASLHTRRLDHLIFTFRQYPRDPDARIAGAASELLGERHRTLLLDSAVASVLNRDCRILNGGQSPASGYLLLATLAQQDCNALMLGYPGDVLAGAPLGPFQPLSLKSNRDLANSLLQAYMSQFAPDQALELVAPPIPCVLAGCAGRMVWLVRQNRTTVDYGCLS